MLMRILALLALGAFPIAGALAQDYPTKPVILTIPFAAGGPTDTLGRHLALAMASTLKQQVIVENVPGAGGTISYAKVAKSRPDGYTVLLAHIGMATAPALYRKPSVNPLTDFEYIGQVADVPMTLIAKKNLPPDNFKEFLA
jgi:putative tricarboxylic transport membrane protein